MICANWNSPTEATVAALILNLVLLGNVLEPMYLVGVSSRQFVWGKGSECLFQRFEIQLPHRTGAKASSSLQYVLNKPLWHPDLIRNNLLKLFLSTLHSKKDIIQMKNTHSYTKIFLEVFVVVMGKF